MAVGRETDMAILRVSFGIILIKLFNTCYYVLQQRKNNDNVFWVTFRMYGNRRSRCICVFKETSFSAMVLPAVDSNISAWRFCLSSYV